MKLSFGLKTGFKNLGTKKLFSFTSIGTISCCVIIFCIFFILASNIHSLIAKVESTVGIQVFFDEELTEDEMVNIAENNFITKDVKSMTFKSSNEAWEQFKEYYFDNKIELAEAFEDDNPLSHSASYEILLNDIDKQYEYVKYISSIDGVRQVNYSNILIEALSSISFGITTFSMILISILIIIAMVLISNTISLATQFRKEENEIMKLIGATNSMIKSPYITEGFYIGLIGSILPIIIISFAYKYIMNYIINNTPFLTNILEPVSIYRLLLPMASISIFFSCLICVLVSIITINKHIKI